MTAKKVLFIGEAATLAHVARPLVLSKSPEFQDCELVFACDPRYEWVLKGFPGRYLPLASVGTDHFLTALARGKPLYSEEHLERYVRDDLKLLEQEKPDVVIGDFRLSLSISARVAGVPYATISNCYWSPYWRPRRYTVPSLPLTRVLPLPIASALFRLARPVAFGLHCIPMNRVRARYGLRSLGSDLRHVYTDADQVLYADIPELYPDVRLPDNHRFIGPVIWSPSVSLPAWWDEIPDRRAVVYVNLGSSGPASLLSSILGALASSNVISIAATAGKDQPPSLPHNARVSRYLPGDDACRRASLVICNGGSPSTQQALAWGKPVIGVAGNLDQFLNMQAIERANAGVTLRADRFVLRELQRQVDALLTSSRVGAGARRVAAWIAAQRSSANPLLHPGPVPARDGAFSGAHPADET